MKLPKLFFYGLAAQSMSIVALAIIPDKNNYKSIAFSVVAVISLVTFLQVVAIEGHDKVARTKITFSAAALILANLLFFVALAVGVEKLIHLW